MEETTAHKKEQRIIIATTNVKEDFRAHADLPNNKRILFSAPFGAGKSFFLTDYFSDNHALTIKLHPIDYSVATNEDIFELMKHDILSALLEKYQDSLDLSEEDFSKILMLQEFVRNEMDLTGVGTALLNFVLPNGKELIKLFEELKKLNEGSLAFRKKHNKIKQQLIEEFLKSLKNKKGSIRENDAITQLIKDYIARIKAANEDKKFVLILDDLDRLDPEHLFRLFNVFTAHNDSQTDHNKFDFDQVIFVCDIKNIYHMFQHRYGKHVDFAGYIDKFYSTQIFNFEFKKYLKESVNKLIMNKYFDGKTSSNVTLSTLLAYDFKNKGEARDWGDFLHEFIGILIDYDLVKVRSFEKFQIYKIADYEFSYSRGMTKKASSYHFLTLVYNLQQFFPRLNELEDAFAILSASYHADYSHSDLNTYSDNPDIDRLILKIAIPFLMEPKRAFSGNERGDDLYFEYFNENGQNLEVHYSIDYNGKIKYQAIKFAVMEPFEVDLASEGVQIPETIKKTYEVKRPNPYWFLLEAFRNAKKFGYLTE